MKIDIKKNTYHIFYSEEDECWLCRIKLPTQDTPLTSHGIEPIVALKEAEIVLNLVLQELQNNEKD